MSDFGKCVTFNPQTFIDAAKQLVDADEVERALKLLENIPAYYRDHTPKEILELKNQIMRYMITANGYMNDEHDRDVNTEEQAKWVCDNTLRGILIKQELERLPYAHVVECGPGEYWLPIGLDFDFSYCPVAMDSKAKEQAMKNEKVFKRLSPANLSEVDKVFVALEIIEHLSNPQELLWECNKHFQGHEPDYIHLSTPLYTYDSRPKDWKTHKLPHLRAYTPREFIMEAQKLWPHYDWQLYVSPVMSLRGVHPNAKFKEHLKV